MTIKSSGNPLSFSEIEAEFGDDGVRRLGKYRTTDSAFGNKTMGQLSNLPLDTGIPKSGTIKFSDFYGKKLNIVVDYYDDTGSSGGKESNILNRHDDGAPTMAATWRYINKNGRVKVVGNFRDKPTVTLNSGQSGTYNINNATSDIGWQGGKKVFIHVNKKVGGSIASQQSHRKQVALRTGVWPGGTELQIDIGSSGRVQGGGGNGRKGKANSGTPDKALPGTSGLGVEYPAQINNNGIIRCGYGGGGGGAGSNSDPNKSKTDYGRSGGGGGGGAGIPAGVGGAQNCNGYTGGGAAGVCGGAGGAGSHDNGGGGGGGADHGAGSGGGGDGGDGGDQAALSQSGDAGSPNAGAGGPRGERGYGMIFSSNSVRNACTGTTDVSNNQGNHAIGGIL